MSKEDKRNKLKSATELKHQPLLNEEIKGKKKTHKPPKRSDHKHDYQVFKVGPSWLRHISEGDLFEKKDNEYVEINSTCSICDKEKKECKRIFIDEWNKKYASIYRKTKDVDRT